MNSKPDIDEQLYGLLSKYILQEADVAERATVEVWLQSNEANRTTLQKLEKIINSPVTADIPVLGINAAWNRILPLTNASKNHANGRETAGKTVRMFTLRRFVTTAAAVIIAIAGVWMLRSKIDADATKLFTASGNYTLPDGSIIQLKENSSLATGKKFGKESRTVSFSGEAFFDIKRDTTQPFIIDMPSGSVQVLGTSFTIQYHQKDSLFKVHVTSGKVHVLEKKSGKSVVLTRGQLFDWKANSADFLVSNNISDWKKKKFTLNGMNFAEAIYSIESIYGTHIRFEKEKFSTITIDGAVFDNQPVEKVLETVCFLANVSFSKTANNSFVIK
jgi:transmembrane sensor